MEVDAVKSFLDDVDSILLTDCADCRELELFQESLDCAEHNECSGAASTTTPWSDGRCAHTTRSQAHKAQVCL